MPGVRLDSLTGLRWWAAFAVFVAHCRDVDDAMGWITWLGWSGVALFFILSGFVLAWSAPHRDAPVDFYRRRFARIYPLYVVALVAAIIVFSWPRGGSSTPWRTVVVQLALLQGWAPNTPLLFGGNPVGWTLSDEAFFYAVFPLLLWTWRSSSVRTWLGISVIGLVWPMLFIAPLSATGQLVDPDSVSVFLLRSPLGFIGMFVIGMGLARAMRLGWRPPWSLRASVLGMVVVVVALVTVGAAYPTWAQAVAQFLLFPLLAPAFAALIAALAIRDVDARPSRLGSRRMVALGAWSYAFYLVHLTILGGLVQAHGGPFSGWSAGAVAALALGLSIAAAAGLHRVVELPLERRLRGTTRARADAAPVQAVEQAVHAD